MRTDNSIPKNEKETLDYIDDSATQLDEHRLAGLQESQNTQLIKDEILQREKKRLETKHGNTHPEVQEAESRTVYNKQMFTGLNNEIEKASIKTEPFNRTSWRVHGRVFNNESKPVKGLTVFLTDQNKRWIEILGSSCTNDLGYYALTVDEKMIDKIDKGQSLFLAVSDKNKKIIFTSAEALIPVKGVIIYRDIYINSEDCVPPPPPYNKKETTTG
jgi:hypothetical protein